MLQILASNFELKLQILSFSFKFYLQLQILSFNFKF